MDKDQAIVRFVKMDDLLAASEAERRFALIVFDAFALMALMLAAIGIYGVLAGSVTERTRKLASARRWALHEVIFWGWWCGRV